MARLKWTLVCERTILEEATNVLSIIGIIEQIKIKAPPAKMLSGPKPSFVPYRFTAVQYWSRSDPKKPERFPTRVRFIGSNGKQFGLAEQIVDLTSHMNARIISVCPAFPLVGPGKITAQIQILNKKTKGWRTVEKYELELVFTASDPTQAPVTAPVIPTPTATH